MRWTGLGTAVLVVMAGWGCSEATGPEESRSDALIPAPYELTLRLDEEKAVGSSVVRVHFIRVMEDSRCPTDELVRCIWEGRGVVALGIRADDGLRYSLTLETRPVGQTTLWRGLRVTLLELTPAATWSPPTDTTAYAIKVRVEPDGR